MDLFVDDRERAVVPHIEPLCTIRIARLKIGDYAFVKRGQVVCVVERKTLADLAASIKDGRMENHERLVELREKTSCRILYVIEGSPFTNARVKYGGISFKALQSKIDSLMFGSGALIIWTKGPAGTATRLAELVTRFEKMDIKGVEIPILECQPPGGPVVGGDGAGGEDSSGNALAAVPAVLMEVKEQTLDSIHIDMLACVKGVSRSTAQVILKHYRLRDLITQQFEPAIIHALKYESGASIGNRAIGICEQLLALDGEIQVKMVMCVKGISESIARLILAAVPFAHLVAWNIDLADVANIRRANGRRLGDALAKRLFECFVYVPEAPQN